MTDRTPVEMAAEALRPFAKLANAPIDEIMWTQSDLRHAAEALAALTAEAAREQDPDEDWAALAASLRIDLGLADEADMPAIYAAFSASRRVSPDREALEEDDAAYERRLSDEESADNLRLIDWIADKIGLPKDEELSRENFAAWLASPAVGEWRPTKDEAG